MAMPMPIIIPLDFLSKLSLTLSTTRRTRQGHHRNNWHSLPNAQIDSHQNATDTPFHCVLFAARDSSINTRIRSTQISSMRCTVQRCNNEWIIVHITPCCVVIRLRTVYSIKFVLLVIHYNVIRSSQRRITPSRVERIIVSVIGHRQLQINPSAQDHHTVTVSHTKNESIKWSVRRYTANIRSINDGRSQRHSESTAPNGVASHHIASPPLRQYIVFPLLGDSAYMKDDVVALHVSVCEYSVFYMYAPCAKLLCKKFKKKGRIQRYNNNNNHDDGGGGDGSDDCVQCECAQFAIICIGVRSSCLMCGVSTLAAAAAAARCLLAVCCMSARTGCCGL